MTFNTIHPEDNPLNHEGGWRRGVPVKQEMQNCTPGGQKGNFKRQGWMMTHKPPVRVRGHDARARRGTDAEPLARKPPRRRGLGPRRRGGGRRDDDYEGLQAESEHPTLPCRLKFTYAAGGRGRAAGKPESGCRPGKHQPGVCRSRDSGIGANVRTQVQCQRQTLATAAVQGG